MEMIWKKVSTKISINRHNFGPNNAFQALSVQVIYFSIPSKLWGIIDDGFRNPKNTNLVQNCIISPHDSCLHCSVCSTGTVQFICLFDDCIPSVSISYWKHVFFRFLTLDPHSPSQEPQLLQDISKRLIELMHRHCRAQVHRKRGRYSI